MYRNLVKYTEGGDKTFQSSYLVIFLLNWVPDNGFYRMPTKIRMIFQGAVEIAAATAEVRAILGHSDDDQHLLTQIRGL